MVSRSAEVAGQAEARQTGTAVGALGGLVLALALAGSIAGWNLAHQRDAGTPAVQPVEVASVAGEVLRAAEPVLTVWVVSTPEQAELLREGMALAQAVRVAGRPERYTVVVAGTDPAAAVLHALWGDAHIGPAAGAARVQVVDVRGAS